MEKNLVKFSSCLSKQVLDLNDKELNVLFMVMGVFSSKVGEKEIYINRKVLKEYVQYKRTNKKEFIELCLNMAETVNNSMYVKAIKNSTAKEKVFKLFDVFEYQEETDHFHIVMNEEYYFLIDDNYKGKNSTTTLDFDRFVDINNKYAKHLYLLLVGFRYSNIFIMDKDELYKIMCMPENWKDSRKKKELNKAVEICGKYIKNCRIEYSKASFGLENVTILMGNRKSKDKSSDKDNTVDIVPDTVPDFIYDIVTDTVPEEEQAEINKQIEEAKEEKAKTNKTKSKEDLIDEKYSKIKNQIRDTLMRDTFAYVNEYPFDYTGVTPTQEEITRYRMNTMRKKISEVNAQAKEEKEKLKNDNKAQAEVQEEQPTRYIPERITIKEQKHKPKKTWFDSLK